MQHHMKRIAAPKQSGFTVIPYRAARNPGFGFTEMPLGPTRRGGGMFFLQVRRWYHRPLRKYKPGGRN